MCYEEGSINNYIDEVISLKDSITWNIFIVLKVDENYNGTSITELVSPGLYSGLGTFLDSKKH